MLEKYDNKDLTTTSIKKGDILFNASLLVNGKKISDIELASDSDREYTAEVMVKNTVNGITSSKYFISGIIGIFIIVILILISIIRSKRRKKSFLSRRSYIRNKHNF